MVFNNYSLDVVYFHFPSTNLQSGTIPGKQRWPYRFIKHTTSTRSISLKIINTVSKHHTHTKVRRKIYNIAQARRIHYNNQNTVNNSSSSSNNNNNNNIINNSNNAERKTTTTKPQTFITTVNKATITTSCTLRTTCIDAERVMPCIRPVCCVKAYLLGRTTSLTMKSKQ